MSNKATATGGAVEIATGTVAVADSVFKQSCASVHSKRTFRMRTEPRQVPLLATIWKWRCALSAATPITAAPGPSSMKSR